MPLSRLQSTGAADPATARLLACLAQPWTRLVLAKPRPAAAGAQKVALRPLLLRGRPCWSFVYSHATRDETHNLDPAQGLQKVAELLQGSFGHAHLFTPEAQHHLVIGKRGKGHLTLHRLATLEPSAALPSAATAPAPASALTSVLSPESHDRQKHYSLSLDRPFLVALGVTTAQHQLVPAMARKWKQINKFIEVFEHALDSSTLAQAQQLKVVDFGAGKAYLSFALHDWLRHRRGVQAEVEGVELRSDLVAQGRQIVQALGLQGMRLSEGDVRRHGTPRMDVMIALHACDVATDHAIHLGLQAGAQIIMCSPCCHKELRPQLLSPHPLRSVFQHGIHAEQQAEMVTDSLRALLLEAQGYETRVFEFVQLEHTRKNKMILAIKRPQPPTALAQQGVMQQVQELKAFFGVQAQCLDRLLQPAAQVQPGSVAQRP